MKRRLVIISILLAIFLSLACTISTQQKEEPNLNATLIALQGNVSSGKSGLDPNCDMIISVEDVNFPDGSTFNPGETFNKSWALQNGGTCTWSSAYGVALISALDYSIMEWYPLNQTVAPGSIANVTVPVKAPQQEGVETYYYMLVNESGQVFGFGKNSENPFWVNFKISSNAQVSETPADEVVDQVADQETKEEVEEKPCLLLGKVKDITIPDGTTMQPDEKGEKTWELLNNGTCTWDANFQIVNTGGDFMTMVNSKPIGKQVKPQGTVQISVPVFAPLDPGTYYSYWKMKSSSGNIFGGGENADNPFWFKIIVPEQEIEPLPEEEPEFIIDWGMQKISWIGLQKCGTVPSNPIIEMQVKIKSVNFNGNVTAQVTIGGTTTYPSPTHEFNTSFTINDDSYQHDFHISSGETKTLKLTIDTSTGVGKYLNDLIEGKIWFHIKYLNQNVTNDLNYYSMLPFEHTCMK